MLLPEQAPLRGGAEDSFWVLYRSLELGFMQARPSFFTFFLILVLGFATQARLVFAQSDTPVAMITGSSYGLGKVLAERAAAQGWKVALVDVRPGPSALFAQ